MSKSNIDKIEKWTIGDVSVWLRYMNKGDSVIHIFRVNQIDGKTMLKMKKHDWRNLDLMPHQLVRICRALSKLKKGETDFMPSNHYLKSDRMVRSSNITGSSNDSNISSSSNDSNISSSSKDSNITGSSNDSNISSSLNNSNITGPSGISSTYSDNSVKWPWEALWK